jgi:hypothetical protein
LEGRGGIDFDAITDLGSFVARLSDFDSIDEISARIVPPNPHFGPFWASLKKYLEKRNLNRVLHRERAEHDESIESELVSLIKREIANNNQENIEKSINEMENPDFGDAAILMAADGYGNARISGISKGRSISIETKDTNITTTFSAMPSDGVLYERVVRIMSALTARRELSSGEN